LIWETGDKNSWSILCSLFVSLYPVLFSFLDGFTRGVGKSSIDPADERDNEESTRLRAVRSMVGSVGVLVSLDIPLLLPASI